MAVLAGWCASEHYIRKRFARPIFLEDAHLVLILTASQAIGWPYSCRSFCYCTVQPLVTRIHRLPQCSTYLHCGPVPVTCLLPSCLTYIHAILTFCSPHVSVSVSRATWNTCAAREMRNSNCCDLRPRWRPDLCRSKLKWTGSDYRSCHPYPAISVLRLCAS